MRALKIHLDVICNYLCNSTVALHCSRRFNGKPKLFPLFFCFYVFIFGCIFSHIFFSANAQDYCNYRKNKLLCLFHVFLALQIHIEIVSMDSIYLKKRMLKQHMCLSLAKIKTKKKKRQTTHPSLPCLYLWVQAFQENFSHTLYDLQETSALQSVLRRNPSKILTPSGACFGGVWSL